jgi:hypothetical protein
VVGLILTALRGARSVYAGIDRVAGGVAVAVAVAIAVAIAIAVAVV